jgi:hypothetical protein
MPPEAAPTAADPSTGSGPPSLTPAEATDKIEALISPKPAKAKAQTRSADDEEKDKPEASPSTGLGGSAESPDAPPSTGSGAGEPEEQPAEEPGPDDPEALEGDEDNAGAEGEEVLFTVKIDGKEVPVPVSEARDGYMRRTDYTQKTQALAQQVQAFQQFVQEVQQERQVYGVLIGALEEQLHSQWPQEPNWQELNSLPDKSYYWTARANWDETQRRLQAIADEKDRLGQLQQMDTVQQLNEHLTRSREYLVEQLPEWRDEKRAKTDKAKIREYALSLGFSEADVDYAYDPRLVIMAHHARLYNELKSNRPHPAPSSGPEALKPGIATHQPATWQAKLTKAKRRLAQTGHPRDAEAAIELILAKGH